MYLSFSWPQKIQLKRIHLENQVCIFRASWIILVWIFVFHTNVGVCNLKNHTTKSWFTFYASFPKSPSTLAHTAEFFYVIQPTSYSLLISHDALNISWTLLKISLNPFKHDVTKQTLNILSSSHCKIFKVRLAIFQRFAWKIWL